MLDGKEHFCPLIKEKCRDDCVWCDHQYRIDDEGIEHHKYCMVCCIYSELISINGGEVIN